MSELLSVRTLGDGMEHSPNTEFRLNSLLLTKPSTRILNSIKPIEPSSTIVRLIPKYVPQSKNVVNTLLSKQREPKFIPYEPYKAAVEPIIAMQIKKNRLKKGSSKNNVQIQLLVKHMSEMRIKKIDKLKEIVLNDDEVVPEQQWKIEKDNYKKDIKKLQETKARLENELKFQTQVNHELKTLLVAAVGEDLETRVQHLTEDKLSLAKALLKSANCLTTNQEQTEWLSGQCEVWKSKFLASSLMVEELARWKSVLTNRVHDLHEVVRKMLSNFDKLHRQILITFDNLNKMHTEMGNEHCNLVVGDIMELGAISKKLSYKLGQNLKKEYESNVSRSTILSETEILAVKLLKTPIGISSSDAVCSALAGAAHSMTPTRSQMLYDATFLQHQPCCSHCKGEVYDI